MKTAGIISEYNPFHNGHEFHIQRTKEQTGSDYVVAVMSGDFVQRGEPALFDKYRRTKMALLCGADLVLELPVLFSTGSAGDFSAGAVSLLDKLGVVDFLSFGSECGNTALLQSASSVLLSEPAVFSQNLQDALKKGCSFPKARSHALAAALAQNSPESSDSISELLSSPNNLLGLEYCTSLTKRNSKIEPFTIKRQGAGYHDDLLLQNVQGANLFASASGIRRKLQTIVREYSDIEKNVFPVIPDALHPLWEDIISKQEYLFSEDLTKELRYCLLTQKNDFSQYSDINRELSDKLNKIGCRFTDWDNLCEQLKSKEITYSKISRALTHILLGITKDALMYARTNDYVPYARILGFRRSASPMLSVIGKNSSIPLISKLADADKFLSGTAFDMLQTDIRASHVYESVLSAKTGTIPRNEYTRQIIII